MNLLEQYKNRLAISEQVYSKAHGGERLSSTKKLAVAKCLENTNKFINEAFANSVGTQRSDLGMFKKFALNLVTVALPNLIAHDLVIVHPMSSMSGYINYIEYTAGSNKGEMAQGEVINDPFRLGKVDANYTANRVVENIGESQTVVGWTPVIVKARPDGSLPYRFLDETGKAIEGGKLNEDGSFEKPEGAVKIAYEYDNVVIPQNDLPVINVQMKALPLIAKARRIAVYYSQIAAFQAKTDYGFDLGDQLAEKAVGQLSYEIDVEITNLLVDNAEKDAELVWNRNVPYGVSKSEHYEGFSEVVEIAKQKIYDRTKRFAPNYMLCASDILPVLSFIKGFKAAPTGSINGPYFAGNLGSLKVFVTPEIKSGEFVIGVNGDDMMSSAAVYAPYMPVVPTQLLGYADGGMSQGWSTMYDLRMLNKDLLVKGNIIREEYVVATKEQA